MQAEILRLIGFGGLFGIVFKDVTLSTEEAEARMCDPAVVSSVDLCLCPCHTQRKLEMGGGGG